MRARILVGALILGTATGAGAQAVGPTVPAVEPTSSSRLVWPVAEAETVTGAAAEAAVARVAEQVRVEASGPDRLGRWLMAAGASLVVAGLADWAAGDEPGALRDRDVAAYGAGLVLFGTGALRSSAAVVVPSGPGDGEVRD